MAARPCERPALVDRLVVTRGNGGSAELKYWPSYNRPDPADISPLIFDVPVFPLLLASPLAVLLSLVLALRWWYVGRSDWKRTAIVAVASFLMLMAWLWFDPGGFFDWWAD
jgi:hypothetical protein